MYWQVSLPKMTMVFPFAMMPHSCNPTSNLEDKIIENIFGKFKKAIPLWMDCIRDCFLGDEMRERYAELINGRIDKMCS
jgi:hypothetical protein